MVNFASFSGRYTGLKVGGGGRRKVMQRRNSARKRGIGITRRIVEKIGTTRRSVVLVIMVRIVAWILGSRHARSGKMVHTNSGSLLHHLLLWWNIIVHSLP